MRAIYVCLYECDERACLHQIPCPQSCFAPSFSFLKKKKQHCKTPLITVQSFHITLQNNDRFISEKSGTPQPALSGKYRGGKAHIGRVREGEGKEKGEGRGRGEKGKEGGREGVGTDLKGAERNGRGLQRAKRSQKEGGSTGECRKSLAIVISSLSITQVSIALTPPFHT
jgi:hypothetical protein